MSEDQLLKDIEHLQLILENAHKAMKETYIPIFVIIDYIKTETGVDFNVLSK